MEIQQKNSWDFTSIWNSALLEREDRPMKERSNLWASELGKSYVDLWLKMRATKLTNPPNPRSLRKFEAGNVFEWIVSIILKRAGILQDSQNWCRYQYPGLIEVTGKADFIAGGKPDFEKWKVEMEKMELPNVFLRGGERIIKYFAENFPDGLEEMPLEIKSLSAFMYDALERKKEASKIHKFQGFHYLKANGYPKTTIVYICRDDLRMMEYVVTPDFESEYKGFIEEMTKYHQSSERPPLEKAIVFDDDLGKFCKNFNVAYSGYLTMLYGFKDQMEFDNKYTPTVSQWNRVMDRVKNKLAMTAKNEDVLKEIEAAGYNLEEIKSKL